MRKKLTETSSKLARVEVTGPQLARVSRQQVAGALGALASDPVIKPSGPVSLFALRQYLVQTLESTGGRPALAGTSQRKKIPLQQAEWQKLEEMATVLLQVGVRTTPGQIASALLHQTLEQFADLNAELLAEQIKIQ